MGPMLRTTRLLQQLPPKPRQSLSQRRRGPCVEENSRAAVEKEAECPVDMYACPRVRHSKWIRATLHALGSAARLQGLDPNSLGSAPLASPELISGPLGWSNGGERWDISLRGAVAIGTTQCPPINRYSSFSSWSGRTRQTSDKGCMRGHFPALIGAPGRRRGRVGEGQGDEYLQPWWGASLLHTFFF